MSYVLQIWENPIPTSVIEADQIHDRLSGEHTAQNPRFIELAKRLTQRYPSMAMPDEGDEEAEDVWTDGPIDGETDCPVYGLGVQTEHLDAVIPFVVSCANALGLTVYDTQAGQAFLPGGKVLTMPGQEPIQFDKVKPSEELTSARQVVKLVAAGLKDLLKQHGFKQGKLSDGELSFKKDMGGLVQEILISANNAGARKFAIRPFASIMIDAGVDVLKNLFDYPVHHIGINSELDKFFKPSPADSTERPSIRRIEVQHTDDVDRAIKAIASYLESYVFPILQECDSIVGIDKYMNSLPLNSCPFNGGGGETNFPIHLIVAHLAENPNVSTLADHYLEISDEYHRKFVEKTISYLGLDHKHA